MNGRILFMAFGIIMLLFIMAISACNQNEDMIIVLKDSGYMSSFTNELTRQDIIVKEAFTLIPGFLCDISKEQAEVLKMLNFIDYIEPDYTVSILDVPQPIRALEEVIPTVENIDWGMRRIHADTAWEFATGEGIKIGVIDTGICTTHPDLIGAVAGGWSAIGNSYEDDNNHGTYCSTVIAARKNGVGIVGVAPKATLYAIKVLNSSGSGSTSNVIRGYEWALSQHLDAVNLSLGSYSKSAAMEMAMDNAAKQGMATIAAAGNDGKDGICYPARSYNAIIVGASGYYDERVSWSNYGDEMSVNGILAPGDWVLAGNKNGTWQRVSGTSISTPHITGIVALLLEYYWCERRFIFRSALQGQTPDRFNGHGLANARGALDTMIQEYYDNLQAGKAVPAGMMETLNKYK